jgi:hypothetical protein
MAQDYDDLLTGRLSDRITLPELLEVAHEHGRLMLSAPAASGKTSLAGRLIEIALDAQQLAIRIDLRRWTPTLQEIWQSSRDTDAGRMALLLERVARPSVTEHELRVAAETGCLIVADGLNEMPSSGSAGLPWVLDAFAARLPWASVVVCDRFQRRTLPSDQWAIATIDAVFDPADPSAASHNALMLDLAGPGADRAATRNEARLLLGHLAEAAGEQHLEELAATALSLYREQASRFFPLDALVKGVGVEVVEQMLAHGALQRDGDHGYFRHHLFHDALAALAIVADQHLWNSNFLDALTFEANSFDAVGLALELINEEEEADRFLTAVYDWNQYAAAYALSRGRSFGTANVSRTLELAMLGVLAERRWDPLAPTVQRVEDSLRVFPNELARALLAASDADEVRHLIAAEVRNSDQPVEWLEVFLGTSTTSALVAALDQGALEGWMAANALRGKKLSEQELEKIIRATESPSSVVRWRAVHTLGAHPNKTTARRLLDALDHDPYPWVRYGSIRSLIEQAGEGGDRLRRWILRQVEGRIAALNDEPKLRTELERALELREPPIGWGSAVEPLLIALLGTARTVHEMDHWRRVGRRITDSIEAARAVA